MIRSVFFLKSIHDGLEALAEVIVSDARVTSKETRFFNMVAEAFQLTPAELAGLIEND